MAEHVVKSFELLLKNWKIFGLFLIIMTVASVLTVGISWDLSEATIILATLIFLVMWLTTIFILRQLMAGNKISLRDGLYNAMAPFITTLVVLAVVAVQSLPILVLIVAYSAAVRTEFLTMPFYALLFLGFAALMIIISGYLLSSSLMALVAVAAPGLYPFKALKIAADLMMGRRIRFIMRLVMLTVVLVAIWAVATIPLALVKAWTGDSEVGQAIISIYIIMVTNFSVMYATAYLYLYYRYTLEA